MTICIGVICEDGAKVVVASDRMLTGWVPPIEYESTEPKIDFLTETSVVLTAGDAIAHTELLNHAIPIIQNERAPPISKIVEILSECYDDQRKKKIHQEILRPRGLDLDMFYENFGKFPPQFSLSLDQEIKDYDYELDMLVAGVDSIGGHIYNIENPGVTSCFDEMGHHEIGSGIIQARTTFISHGYSKNTPLNEAVYLTYEAKRNAESAPGVGRWMDLGVISNSSFKILDEKILGDLDKIYRERNKGKPLDTYKDKLDKLNSALKEEGDGNVRNK